MEELNPKFITQNQEFFQKKKNVLSEKNLNQVFC